MGGFAMALGGALGGLGQGLVMKAKAEREEHLEELRAQRRAQELKDDQNFRKTEAEDRRKFDADERKAGEKFQSDEAEKKRKADEATSGDLVTGNDGGSYVRKGTTLSPLTTPEGKPFKQKDSKATAADIEKMVEDRLQNELGENFSATPRDPKVLDARRAEIRKALRQDLGIDEKPAASTTSGKPEGMSNDDIIKQAQDAIARGADEKAVRERLKGWGISF